MSFDLEKARKICNHCCAPFSEVTDEHVSIAMQRFYESLAEVERLRGEMENYGDDYVCQMKSKDARIKELEAENKRLQEFRDRVARILKQPLTDCDDLLILSLDSVIRHSRRQAARIQELEDALVEERASRVYYEDSCPFRLWNDIKLKDKFLEKAKWQLQRGGKIGPEDAKPREGLYGKYRISKVDGSPVDPKADYFVLRLDADQAAQKAALRYAQFTHDRKLGIDLRNRVSKYLVLVENDFEPRSWQITDERRRALSEATTFLPEGYGGDTARIRNVLRGMLQEVEQ